MDERITFAHFDAILGELGFRKEVVRGSHVNYWHATMDAPLMIRLHKPKDLVPTYVLLGTRVQLDNLGIVPADRFEEMLKAAA